MCAICQLKMCAIYNLHKNSCLCVLNICYSVNGICVLNMLIYNHQETLFPVSLVADRGHANKKKSIYGGLYNGLYFGVY